jgi:hypothetical protein
MFEKLTIIVRAERDDEAGVWVATSEDIDGLAVESETFEALHDKVVAALQDLLELNGPKSGAPEIPVHIMAHQLSRVRVPC